jgi:alanine-alpha-ketoisovalerate/valine-pyruvate aminotransferase
MDKLIEKFNEFFRNDARVILRENSLEITVGSKTAIFSFPELIGGQNEPNKPTD